MNTSEEITLFHKILKKEIPSTCVYENDKIYAFRDINPQAAVHVVIIPKELKGLNMLEKATEDHIDLLGNLILGAKLTAEKLELKEGYRVVINNGRYGCQSVNYIHLHLLGGQQLGWPPGTQVDI
jgi:histidine triad (HIT) family protein